MGSGNGPLPGQQRMSLRLNILQKHSCKPEEITAPKRKTQHLDWKLEQLDISKDAFSGKRQTNKLSMPMKEIVI